MRLGQISRKYNLKPTQIRDFIQNRFKVEIDTDLNTKLDDTHVEALEKKFENATEVPVVQEETSTNEPEVQVAPALVRPETVGAETVAAENAAADEAIEAPHHKVNAKQDSGSAESSSPTSGDPFIPKPVDPEAELIKAPKIKLEGPKVIGKIELPGKKVAGTAVEAETEADAEAGVVEGTANGANISESKDTGKPARDVKGRNSKFQKEPVSEGDEEFSIYKDKKGIYHFSRQQRENRKKSLERIRLAKTGEGKKRSKAKHYQKKVKPIAEEVKTKQRKHKDAAKEERTKKAAPKPAPKGMLGRFWHWLKGS